MALRKMTVFKSQTNPHPGVVVGTPSYVGRDRGAAGNVQTPFRNKLSRKVRPGF